MMSDMVPDQNMHQKDEISAKIYKKKVVLNQTETNFHLLKSEQQKESMPLSVLL